MNNEASWWSLFLPKKSNYSTKDDGVDVCLHWRKKLLYQVLVSELIWLKWLATTPYVAPTQQWRIFGKPFPLNSLFSPAAPQHSCCLLTRDFSGRGRLLLLLLFLQLLLHLAGGGWRGISCLTHSDGVARSTSGHFRCPPFIAFMCYLLGILLLHLQRTTFF